MQISFNDDKTEDYYLEHEYFRMRVFKLEAEIQCYILGVYVSPGIYYSSDCELYGALDVVFSYLNSKC